MRVFRNSRGKKGSLSLSINAIVVLILAITMLGLGLGFMKNMFGGVTDQFSQVTDEVKADMIDRLTAAGKKVTLNAYEVKMKPSETYDLYLAIQNEIAAPGVDQTFHVGLSDPRPIDAANSVACVDKAAIKFVENNVIAGGDAKVVQIKVKSDARDGGSCEYTFTIREDSAAGQVYGKEDFVITVR
jgi:hypothetical protein